MMRLPWLYPVVFFALICFAAVAVFPSARERGHIYSIQRDHDRAYPYLRDVFLRYPDDTANSIRYLEALRYFAKYEEFDAVTRQLLAMFPDDRVLMRRIAHLCEDMMRMDRAVVLWERLLLKDPGDTEIRRKLIAQYRFDGDTDNIVALLERSIETVGKREPFLYYDLLDAYEALGDEDKAYALLAKMSNVFPADVSVIAGRAYLAMKKGLYREARGQFALLKEKDPLSLEWYTEDVRAAYMLDDIPSAWAVFDDALRRFGSQQRLFDMRDMLLARAKDEDELLERLAYCAKAAPDDGVLWKRIGFIRLKRREQQAALDAFKRYNQLTGGDHETYAAVGDLYAVLGNQQQSRDAYADALRLLRERQRR